MENNTLQTSVRFENITKRFGDVIASNNISFDIYRGEILSLLGENGSGKTTLMNMLAGIYFPDEGKIFVQDKEVTISSPRDAFNLHIGMIHQHFKLVEVFSCIENIVLGVTKEKSKIKYAREAVKEICDKYGFEIDLDKKVYDMSVSEKQTLEIVKALYRGADFLILDEPTAVLTPSEIKHLFDVLRNMKKDGKSIVIITHKLNEVMEISDRVVVVSKGEFIGAVTTSSTNEMELTEMMVGRRIELNIDRSDVKEAVDRLFVENLTIKDFQGVYKVKDVSFTARGGEILGIAGIAGSGQREILETIAGIDKSAKGSITYLNPENNEVVNLMEKTPRQIRDLGVALSFVPEDRLGMGLVANMNLIDNVMLRSYQKGKYALLDRQSSKTLTDDIVDSLQVKTPSDYIAVRKLSGGNVQKILVGREIANAPKVLMAAYPVRGLDIKTSYTIYNLLDEQKRNGTAVIFVGEDLDVLLALCDRILVVCDGKVSGIVDARTTSKEEVGYLMVKQNGGNK